MVALLLYGVGFLTTLATLALVVLDLPRVLEAFRTSFSAADAGILDSVLATVPLLGWALWPLIGGLLMLGFGRMIMLLAAINRALRGTP